MPYFQDQMGHGVFLEQSPQRIVSLVPSQTELLFDLGLGEKIVGRTKFCIHPKFVKDKKIVGGTKNFHFENIDKLVPDLIIANKEENYKEGIERLRSKYPVWTSDISNLADALSMIREIGKITNTEIKAQELIQKIQVAFGQIQPQNYSSVLYLIWQQPYMAAARGTFIDDMLQKMGLQNVLETQRYPILEEENISQLAPDFIFLSSEPYPFKQEHIAQLKKISPCSETLLVDGEMFSWYGSRLLQSANYFSKLSHRLCTIAKL